MSFSDEYVRSLYAALAELGVFQKGFGKVPSFSNHLWLNWGYTADELVQDAWYELIHPEDRERVLKSYNELLGGERELFQEEYRFRTKDGKYHSLYSSGRFLSWESENPNPDAYIGLDIDISHLKEELAELVIARIDAETRARQAEMLQQAGKIVTANLDLQNLVRLILAEIAKVAPFKAGELYSVHDGKLRHISIDTPLDADSLSYAPELDSTTEAAQIFDRKKPLVSQEKIRLPLIFQDEGIGLLSLDADDDEPFSVKQIELILSLSDFIAIALANARLYRETRRLAMQDSLSGLPTRRWFVSHAETALNHAFRYHRPVALLMLDIDNFKNYNDNYGHPAGDAAIRRTAEICKNTLRQADLTCRYGGEEFAVLLIETEPAAAREVAERLRAAVEKAEIEEGLPQITISIGLACFEATEDQQPLGLDELISEADKQLYRAKVEGKNRVAG